MTDSAIPDPKPRFARWLMEPMLANKAIYIKVGLAATMINLFGIVTSLYTMTVYDRVLPNNAFNSLLALSIGLGIVIVFDFVLRVLRAYFIDFAGVDIDAKVGAQVFDKLLTMRLDGKRRSTGAITGVMRELETLRDFFASATMTALVDIPFILLTLVIIAMIGGVVVFVPLVLIPIVILAGWITSPALDRLAARSLGQALDKQTVLVETVGSLEMVKSAGAGGLLTERWLRSLQMHGDYSSRQRLISTMSVTVAASANTISYAGVVIVGVFQIADDKMTMGALIACSIIGGRAMQPLAQIASLLSRISTTRLAYRQIDEMMEQKSEAGGDDALQPARLDGRVELRNVTFTYPGAAEKTLDGLSLTVQPGDHIALLGRVGSGKSTIAKLLLNLYDPQEGLVLVDGTDVRQYDAKAARRHVGVVLQDPSLLTGTVRENIALGRPEVDMEEVLRACKVSGAHDFLGRMANGYDLRLADRGDSLSGGQRQSIAIARALAGKPPVLVFDEPTSAMDNATEYEMIVRLEQEIKGRTFILITHRPALLRLVNRVAVIENGRVAVDGPRDAVLKELQRPKSATVSAS